MIPLDTRALHAFLKLAGDKLTGDWVIVGGSVLPMLGVDHRSTVDIDIAGPDDADMAQTLALMEIADSLGLPVEAINQAASYFLRRIDGWEQHLVPLHRGSSARLFRPDPTLFLLLKIPRLSESDLADCLAFLDYAAQHGETIDRPRVAQAIADRIATTVKNGPSERLHALQQRLASGA